MTWVTENPHLIHRLCIFLQGKWKYPYCMGISPLVSQHVKQDQRPWGKTDKSPHYIISFSFFGFVYACLTKTVPHHWNRPMKIWMSLLEEGMQPVDLRGYRVHYRLAVGGAVIEKQVQQCVIGEMSQPADAGQSDSLDVPRKAEWETKAHYLSNVERQITSPCSVALTHQHRWHHHVERCASWPEGTPLFRSCLLAVRVYNAMPRGKGKHSWSHLLKRGEYQNTPCTLKKKSQEASLTTLYDGSKTQITSRADAMDHKHKVIYFFWLPWKHTYGLVPALLLLNRR